MKKTTRLTLVAFAAALLLYPLVAGFPLATLGAGVTPAATMVAPAGWGDQDDGTFKNPVLPADYSDIDAIRVGTDYYAISSTFQYSPGMVILHSKDLVNWRILAHAVADVTQISPEMNWDRMNRYGKGIWAGSIRYHAGQFWLYFGTPNEGYFMTTARNPAGPWTPLVPVMKEGGWDDCCPFWDDDGQGYLVGTRFYSDPRDRIPYKIHLFKLTPDGKGLVPGFDLILHQSKGSEANKLYKWNGLYYHFFSEVRAEGRVVMMGRAKAVTGPYEIRQLLHVNRIKDREPNQGGIVQTEKGDWWFVTHQGVGGYEGRTMCLLPITWREGWPIPGVPGPDGIGAMVWHTRKPIGGYARVMPQASDDFSGPVLQPQWEWNYQPRQEKWSLTERPGWLRLHAFKPIQAGNLLKAGNTLTQRLMGAGGGEVTIKVDVSHMADGQAAGLCHYGGRYAWLGITQAGGNRHITCSSNGTQTTGASVNQADVWLRSIISDAGDTTWSFSFDGKAFTVFGEKYKFGWANYRGDRIGIFSYNDEAEAGYVDVDEFDYILVTTHPAD
jgi:beta-xylosidase